MNTPDAKLPELLPCPFCGGKARNLHGDGFENALHSIGCESCCAVMEGNEDTRESAIAAWNRREAIRTAAGDARDKVLTIIDKWMVGYDHFGTGSCESARASEKEWAEDRAKIEAALTPTQPA